MLSTGLAAAKLLRLPGEDSPVWAIFDPTWYARAYSDECATLGNASPTALLGFYLEDGQGQGHSPNKYFDETWYRGKYPDISRGVQEARYASGFDQYCRQGHRTLAPHWLFAGEQYYRDQNPGLTEEIADAANGYDHFLRLGARDSRKGHPFFDPAIYQSHVDPVAASESADVGPFLHFLDRIESGLYEVRASQYFDPHWYLGRYPDVASAIRRGIWRCSLHHYLTNDTPTKFDPIPGFSEAEYLRSYPDIAAAVYRGRFRNGYAHFIHVGSVEGRSAGRAGASIFDLLAGGHTNEPIEAFESEAPLGDAVRVSDKYQGTLDVCSHARLEGWAVKDGMPAELEIAVNDQMIGKTVCGSRRPDLVRHGLPIDAGFQFTFDAPIAPTDRVSVRFVGGPDLTNSPTTPLSVETSGTNWANDGWAKDSEFLRYLVDLCGLLPSDAVLDIGCGSGRTAIPLAGYLNHEGRYAGFDIAPKAVAWCGQNISQRHANFDFAVSDVQRTTYNPTGRYNPADFPFPYPDAAFDVVLAVSEFTRMLPAGVKHYMEETVRVLKPGGRSLIAFFLLNDESVALSEKAKGAITFDYETQGARAADRDNPEAAIAYPENFVRALFNDCGLEVREPVRYGTWCGRPNGMSGQDIVIAVKPT
jgi:SAM-dependent methyltransferase